MSKPTFKDCQDLVDGVERLTRARSNLKWLVDQREETRKLLQERHSQVVEQEKLITKLIDTVDDLREKVGIQ